MKINQSFFSLSIFMLAISGFAFVNPSPVPVEKQLEEGGQLSFAEFLSHFEKVDNTFEIGLEDFSRYAEIIRSKKSKKLKSKSKRSAKPRLIDRLADVEFGMYSRMGPPEILPVARFYPNKESVAVIYVPYRRMGGISNVAHFKMALFDLKGNAISQIQEENETYKETFMVAYTNYQNTTTFKLDEEGNIWQNKYEKIWLKDIKQKGVKDNEVIGYNLKDTNVFEIKANGLVAALKDYPVSGRASLK